MSPRTDPCACPPDAAPSPSALGDDADAELARLAKALGHPTRVRIVGLLAGRTECTCGEVVDALASGPTAYAQSTVSEHLRVLKEAGLVRGEISGPNVCYCLSNKTLDHLRVLVAALAEGGPGRADKE